MKKLNIINMLYQTPKHQQGAVLLLMLVIMVVGASTFLVHTLSNASIQLKRDEVTADALKNAKEALIGYSASANRPGDLPCPDNHVPGSALEGTPSTPCNINAIGRLPWKTLGLPDLRDGSGERLWYAVSNNFKNSTPLTPLNSNTTGTISVRSADGTLKYDASSNSGAVALVIAPGEPIQRTDQAAIQDRSITGSNNAINYLEIANGEDNASFTDGNTDGFIQGRIKDTNNKTILNDQILIISHDVFMQAIQKRVMHEVVNALNKYYCGDVNVNPAGGCLAAGGNRFYPRPADFTDTTCLGNSDIVTGCNSVGSLANGRIPASPATPWSPTSLLRGSTSNNWFQENGWREVIYYAVAPACTDGTNNCNGAGYLTLHSPPGTPMLNQKVIVIASGSPLTGQTRSGMGSPKNNLNNYLEGENLSPLDNVYTKADSAPFNDLATNIP